MASCHPGCLPPLSLGVRPKSHGGPGPRNGISASRRATMWKTSPAGPKPQRLLRSWPSPSDLPTQAPDAQALDPPLSTSIPGDHRAAHCRRGLQPSSKVEGAWPAFPCSHVPSENMTLERGRMGAALQCDEGRTFRTGNGGSGEPKREKDRRSVQGARSAGRVLTCENGVGRWPVGQWGARSRVSSVRTAGVACRCERHLCRHRWAPCPARTCRDEAP